MEFFLVVPLLIVVLVAGIGVVSVARTRIELLGAVREGARVAATTPDPAKAVSVVRDSLAPGMRDQVRISVSRPAVVGRPARVNASYHHTLALPLIDDLDFEIRVSASMLVER
ncbi:MAG TPA: hypothetical protein VE569_13855 [Acidimicrobiia bacterium]|nr:hypothetical protein [Acidimicrobiia bacterium]